jgi:hypothetical protein
MLTTFARAKVVSSMNLIRCPVDSELIIEGLLPPIIQPDAIYRYAALAQSVRSIFVVRKAMRAREALKFAPFGLIFADCTLVAAVPWVPET